MPPTDGVAITLISPLALVVPVVLSNDNVAFELVIPTDVLGIGKPAESLTVAFTVRGVVIVVEFAPDVVMVVPVTLIVLLPLTAPEVAVMVIVLLALLVPGVSVACTMPLESVIGDATTRSPESAVKSTSASLIAVLPTDLTRTVMSTERWPSDESSVVLTKTSTFPAGTTQSAPVQGVGVVVAV